MGLADMLSPKQIRYENWPSYFKSEKRTNGKNLFDLIEVDKKAYFKLSNLIDIDRFWEAMEKLNSKHKPTNKQIFWPLMDLPKSAYDGEYVRDLGACKISAQTDQNSLR